MKPSNYGYFESALLKLRRARVHANELHREIEEFLSKSPYKLVVDDSKEQKVLRVEQTINTPSIIPLLLGDFVHNCRSALDHLATDLVLANHGGISGLYFPTGINQEKYHESLCGPIRKAGDQVVAKLKEAEIYRGGMGSSIRGLHELDIADKHKMLIPSVSTITLTNVKIDRTYIPKFTITIEDSSTHMISIHGDMKRTIEFDEEVIFDIGIFDSECFSKESLVKVIETIFEDTKKLVLSFKESEKFPRRRTTI